MKLLSFFYNFIDMSRYLFFGQRTPLTRPLICFNYKIRFFIKKYGQNRGHFNFKSQNKSEETDFLQDYFYYLSYTKPHLNFTLTQNSIYVKTRLGNVQILFQNKMPCYLYKGDNGAQGCGGLSLSLENGILV